MHGGHIHYRLHDSLADYGLSPIELADRPTFDAHFRTLRRPLSDYTFAQFYTWRNSLHLAWKIIDDHLCAFANGSGDLTLLMPPIGTGNGGGDRALRRAFELMDQYNADHGVPDRSRIEYVSDELLERFDRVPLMISPMSADYIYDTQRMIDLAGGDLASKRQAKSRFLRLYPHRVESYDAGRHLDGCLALLGQWRSHQDAGGDCGIAAAKRTKETAATELALRSVESLGLSGKVVYVTDPLAGESLRAFTLGEPLGDDASSILIEKTDLSIKGLAQFIFSDFCQSHWAARPRVNVGDDWGLESLAWTKMSYRPVDRLQKHAIGLPRATAVAPGFTMRPVELPLILRPARLDDVPALVAMEHACFDESVRVSPRQMKYLQSRAVCLVAERDGAVVGQAIALVRRFRRGAVGRIYSVAVDPKSRGNGVGRSLVNALLAQLVGRGVKRVFLEVEATNNTALSLYGRLNFATVKTLPNYYGFGRDGLRLMCDATAESTTMPMSLAA